MTLTNKHIAEILRLHQANGGMTWKVGVGSLLGQELWAAGRPNRVAAWPLQCPHCQERILPTTEDVYDAWRFIGSPEVFGSWEDMEKPRVIFEALSLHASMEQALAVARRRQGRFIFDLKTGSVKRVCL